MAKLHCVFLLLALAILQVSARNVPEASTAGLDDQKNFIAYGGVGGFLGAGGGGGAGGGIDGGFPTLGGGIGGIGGLGGGGGGLGGIGGGSGGGIGVGIGNGGQGDCGDSSLLHP